MKTCFAAISIHRAAEAIGAPSHSPDHGADESVTSGDVVARIADGVAHAKHEADASQKRAARLPDAIRLCNERFAGSAEASDRRAHMSDVRADASAPVAHAHGARDAPPFAFNLLGDSDHGDAAVIERRPFRANLRSLLMTAAPAIPPPGCALAAEVDGKGGALVDKEVEAVTTSNPPCRGSSAASKLSPRHRATLRHDIGEIARKRRRTRARGLR